MFLGRCAYTIIRKIFDDALLNQFAVCTVSISALNFAYWVSLEDIFLGKQTVVFLLILL